MADTQYQALTLSNGNAAQNQVLDYYNQLMKQLGTNVPSVNYEKISVPDMPQMQQLGQTGSLYNYYQTLQQPASIASQFDYTPTTITAPNLGAIHEAQAVTTNAPQMLEYRELAAPDKITPQKIQIAEQNQEDLAKQVSAYLRPYVDNAINSRYKSLAQDRANLDVDAASRGMGASTYLTDTKNRAAQAAQSDIAAMENEFIGNVGQQVYKSYQAYLDRVANADTQNALLDYNAQDANIRNAMNVAAQNLGNWYDVNKTNINNQMTWDEANAARQQQVNLTNTERANARDELAASYDYNTQLANAENRRLWTSLAQQAAEADIANQTNWALQGLNAYNTDLDREAAANQYNTTAQNNAIMAYWKALNNAALADKQNEMNLGLNSQDLYMKLMQLAMGYAGDLAKMQPSGGGGAVDNSSANYTPGMTISEMFNTGAKKVKKNKASATQTAAQAIAQAINSATAKVNNAKTASGTKSVLTALKDTKNTLR